VNVAAEAHGISGAGAPVVDPCGELVGHMADVTVCSRKAYAIVQLHGYQARMAFIPLGELSDSGGMLHTERLAIEIRVAANILG
jgi:hypothetical protein